MAASVELRLHGRGGQGGVTCAKILAAAYSRLGKYVQTFGDYAGERSGAPVRAYTRVADEEITNRNKVYRPDHLVVLDASLLGEGTLAGLKPGGTLLLNTPDGLDAFDGRYERYRLAVVDATAIARRHGIGTRTVVIVNTTIAGAFAKAHGVSLEVLEAAYGDLGFLSNFEAAKEAYHAAAIREPRAAAAAAAADEGIALPESLPDVMPLTEHTESGPTGLKTGAWSTQRPVYVENLAPCNAFCPAGNDVVGFVQAAASDGEAAAAAVLGKTTPLAGVCGHVCPAPCQEGCNRVEYDGAVQIRGLERWIAGHADVAETEVREASERKRFAIVGSGPAGLAAAYDLARSGHEVVIFEGEQELGGVLRTGIPEWRLPRDVLDKEIAAVLALGVETKTGTFLKADDLKQMAASFDAVIVASGLQWLRSLKLDGHDLEGIEQGIHFLHRVNLEGGVSLSGHVVVLGGGNTAFDCARSALRAGAEKVTIAYRRTRKEMPAIGEEIDGAEAEGVVLLERQQPVAFLGDGRVTGIELAAVDMGEPDESGRRRPVVSDRTARFDCNAVLLAVGQSAYTDLMPEGWEDLGNVFTAGDFATGDGTVTHAIGNGRRMAGQALRSLGFDVEVFERPERERAVPVTDIRLDHFAKCPPADARGGLENGLEAHRCFACGHCTSCDTCLVYCPEGIIRRQEDGYEVDYSYCKGCGICVEECPRRAIEMRTE